VIRLLQMEAPNLDSLQGQLPVSCGPALERLSQNSRFQRWAEPSFKPTSGERSHMSDGFTLLEVLVSLTILAIGVALVLSLISGSLGNIRKVQLKTRTVEHAEAVMELALLDDSNNEPRTFTGDFEDGTRWAVRIDDYEMPIPEDLQPRSSPQNMPVKLLSYTVEMFNPDSRALDYRLQTLKLVKPTLEEQRMRIQR
jgi:prepilin-type N-terminal cleavage/methylation domain-containing protein